MSTHAILYSQGLLTVDGVRTDLVDTWLVLNPEPQPRSTDPDVRRNALTFPSDDPVKRIDFVLVATPSKRAVATANCTLCSHSVIMCMPAEKAVPCKGTEYDSDPSACVCSPIVDSIYLIGQDAHPSTPVREGEPNVGMTHARSPLYASDHR